MSLRRSTGKFAVMCFALAFFLLQPGVAQSETAAMSVQEKETFKKVTAEYTSIIKGGERQGTPVSLEQAVKIAKNTFLVPEGMDQFSTGFIQTEKMAFWELRWYRTGDPGGSMNVSVNAETGEIWSMHRWTPPAPGEEYRGLPKYTREQLEKTAAALAERLQPERFKETRLQPGQGNNYFIPFLQQKRGQVEYRYHYARIVDGVVYPENGISVTINGDTGEVTGFNLNWEDKKDFPPAAGRMTLAHAEQVFRAESGPELNYFRPRVPGGKEVPLKLVYRLPGPGDQVIIDALTGELLSKEEIYKYYDMGGGDGGEPRMANSAPKENELTPVEEVAIKEAKNLLSRDKALETAKSYVKVPAGYTLTNSQLQHDYLFKEKKNWCFNWQSDWNWISVSVDAFTGELVSFNIDRYHSRYDRTEPSEVKFSKEAARKIAEEFINKIQPDKWRQVVFESVRPDYWPVAGPEEKPRPRLYEFNWVRTANGVKFPQNGFYLQVDSTTGEITEYRMTWWDVAFPASLGVISKEAAADKYLREAPLKLAYLKLWSSDHREDKVHLVYYMPRRNFAMLDAFTGNTLNSDGDVVSSRAGKAKFKDMEGHPAKEAVELLARSGIVTGENGKFRPDDVITQAELIAMLVKSSGQHPEISSRVGNEGGEEPWYRPYYDAAVRIGLISAGEKPDPNAPVTREVLARLTIHALDLYNVARLSDIYMLNFRDAGEVTDYLRGHVALSVGLGLIDPVEGKFNPKGLVTRAEAATSVVRLLTNGK